ncbi:uncharacterized protein SCHCODRAFT_02665430 [Schizophyllum commune H4-8]|nr:uncharacterized protein SCHCODRAFT_02665430 [Schizophyllum commune H4-8]KAI5895034.1 hypothetical protein SCHCODRAFT_02665430 [Schizophyllum commune H4-8]
MTASRRDHVSTKRLLIAGPQCATFNPTTTTNTAAIEIAIMSQQPLINGTPGTTVVLPGTKAACILRPQLFNGVDENSFHVLPQDRLYANWPRIRGKLIPYETYSTYGREWFSPSCLVFQAETKPSDPAVPSQRFALKVAFNVVDGKPCHQFLRNFCIEARFYARRLKHLQGKSVPKHYGVWTCSTPWGGTMGCAIMEWGGVPFKEEFIGPGEQGEKQRLDIMYAMKAIHDVGYEHTDLVEPNYRHLLYDTERQRPYIIDFSRGEKHKCHPRMAIKAYKTPPDPYVFGCMELRDLGVAIGLFGLGPLFGPEACPEVQEANEKFFEEQELKERLKRVKENKARHARLQARDQQNMAQTSTAVHQPLIGDEPGVEIQLAGTATSIILRPCKYGRGLDANSFRALPPHRFVTALPRISHRQIPFERYKTWCTDWCTSSSLVFYAETFPSDRSATRKRFAIKAALHIEPGEYGDPHLAALYREAVFYQEHLAELQGRCVPRHYGIWIGTTPWGVSIACAFMEWAGLPYSSPKMDKSFERADRRMKAVVAVLALHKAGFQHNGLGEDTRHILFDESRERAFLIGFQYVEPHQCGLKMPLKEYSGPPAPHILGCEELWEIGCSVHFFGNGPSFGPEADSRVQAANQKALDEYNKKKRVEEARARLYARLEQHRQRLAEKAARRPPEVTEAAPVHVLIISGSGPYADPLLQAYAYERRERIDQRNICGAAAISD